MSALQQAVKRVCLFSLAPCLAHTYKTSGTRSDGKLIGTARYMHMRGGMHAALSPSKEQLQPWPTALLPPAPMCALLHGDACVVAPAGRRVTGGW